MLNLSKIAFINKYLITICLLSIYSICAKDFEVPDYNVTTNSLFPTNLNDFKFWSELDQAYDIDNHIIWVNDNHWLKLTLTGAEFMRFGIVSLSVQYNLAYNSDYSYRKTFDCSYYTMIRKNNSLTIESSCMNFSYSIYNDIIIKKIKLKLRNEVEGEFEMKSLGKGVKAWNDKGRFNQKNNDKYIDQVILAFKGIKGSAAIDGTHKINFTNDSAAVMAHQTMNVLPTDFFNRGNTYYVVAGDYQVFVFQFYPNNGQFNPKNNRGYGYTIVYKGNELKLASGNMNYELTDGEIDSESGYPFSTALKFVAEDAEKGIKVSQEDNNLKLSYSVGALKNYPFYYAWLVEMIVGNPWIYNYLAQGNVIIEDSGNSINVVGDVFIMNEFYSKK